MSNFMQTEKGAVQELLMITTAAAQPTPRMGTANPRRHQPSRRKRFARKAATPAAATCPPASTQAYERVLSPNDTNTMAGRQAHAATKLQVNARRNRFFACNTAV